MDPLQPITDPDAISFESGNTLDESNLTAPTKLALDCLRLEVSSAGSALNVTSAYRPQAYQDHLYEISTKHKILSKLVLQQHVEECKPVPYYGTVHPEKLKHGLNYIVGKASSHSSGKAFDANWGNVKDIDELAKKCGLLRPFPVSDMVHFEVLSPNTPMHKFLTASMLAMLPVAQAATYEVPSKYGIKITVDARHEMDSHGLIRARYAYRIDNTNAPNIRSVELGSDSDSDSITSKQLLNDKSMLINQDGLSSPAGWEGTVLRAEEGNAKKAISWQVLSADDRTLGIQKGQSGSFVVYASKAFFPLANTAMVVGFDSYKYLTNPVVEVKSMDLSPPTINTAASASAAVDRPGWLKVAVDHALTDDVDPYPETYLSKIEANQAISEKDFEAAIGTDAKVIYLKQTKDRVYTLYYKALDATGNAGTSKTKVSASK